MREVIPVLVLAVAPLARGDIAGFTAGSGPGTNQWTVNAPMCCSGAPTITAASNTLHLSQAGGYGGGSAFYNTPQNLGVGAAGCTVSFDLQLKVGTDLRTIGGMTLVFQNDPRGATAIGSCNAAYSYGTAGWPYNGTAIAASTAFYLDFATARFGFVENPATNTAGFTNIPSGSVTAGGYFPDMYLDLTRTQSADPIHVTINYDGVKTLTATLTDFAHPNSTSLTYTVSAADLGAATGSSNGTAYVGFTEGDNGTSYVNDITNVSFTAGFTAPPGITPTPITPPTPVYPPYAGPGKVWRIHPIGDSITNGEDSNGYNGGYRTVLNTLLNNSGVPHQFVGTLTGGPPALIAAGQANHDGHDGTGAAYVLAHIYVGDGTGWLETQHPDIVLLQIGINDNLSTGLATTETNLDQIVQTMFAWAQTNNPVFQLLIARISPYSSYNAGVWNYDDYIANTLVPKYQALGQAITVVDQYSPLERVDRAGNLKDPTWIDPYLFGGSPHLDQAGYNRMGNAWYKAILPATASNWAWRQVWLAANGLPADGTGTGALTASPAGDGISNLAKFALGINAWTNGYQGHYATGTVGASGTNYLMLTYTRPDPAPGGVSYLPESGPDLSTDSWSNANTVLVSTNVSDGLCTTTVRDTIAIGAASSRFLRLHITSP